MTKKTHPHSLPHLSDATPAGASKPDHDALMAGSAAWADKVGPGKDYEFTHASETALDDHTDMLTLVRKKVA